MTPLSSVGGARATGNLRPLNNNGSKLKTDISRGSHRSNAINISDSDSDDGDNDNVIESSKTRNNTRVETNTQEHTPKRRRRTARSVVSIDVDNIVSTPRITTFASVQREGPTRTDTRSRTTTPSSFAQPATATRQPLTSATRVPDSTRDHKPTSKSATLSTSSPIVYPSTLSSTSLQRGKTTKTDVPRSTPSLVTPPSPTISPSVSPVLALSSSVISSGHASSHHLSTSLSTSSASTTASGPRAQMSMTKASAIKSTRGEQEGIRKGKSTDQGGEKKINPPFVHDSDQDADDDDDESDIEDRTYHSSRPKKSMSFSGSSFARAKCTKLSTTVAQVSSPFSKTPVPRVQQQQQQQARHHPSSTSSTSTASASKGVKSSSLLSGSASTFKKSSPITAQALASAPIIMSDDTIITDYYHSDGKVQQHPTATHGLPLSVSDPRWREWLQAAVVGRLPMGYRLFVQPAENFLFLSGHIHGPFMSPEAFHPHAVWLANPRYEETQCSCVRCPSRKLAGQKSRKYTRTQLHPQHAGNNGSGGLNSGSGSKSVPGHRTKSQRGEASSSSPPLRLNSRATVVHSINKSAIKASSSSASFRTAASPQRPSAIDIIELSDSSNAAEDIRFRRRQISKKNTRAKRPSEAQHDNEVMYISSSSSISPVASERENDLSEDQPPIHRRVAPATPGVKGKHQLSTSDQINKGPLPTVVARDDESEKDDVHTTEPVGDNEDWDTVISNASKDEVAIPLAVYSPSIQKEANEAVPVSVSTPVSTQHIVSLPADPLASIVLAGESTTITSGTIDFHWDATYELLDIVYVLIVVSKNETADAFCPLYKDEKIWLPAQIVSKDSVVPLAPHPETKPWLLLDLHQPKWRTALEPRPSSRARPDTRDSFPPTPLPPDVMISYPSTKPISGAVFTNMKSALATYMMALQVKYKVRLLPVADVCELSPDTDEVLSVAHSDLRPFWSYDAPKEAANGDNEDIEMAEDEIVPGSVDKGDANEQVVAIYRYKALQQAIDAASCYSTCSLTVGDIIKAETKVRQSTEYTKAYNTWVQIKNEISLRSKLSKISPFEDKSRSLLHSKLGQSRSRLVDIVREQIQLSYKTATFGPELIRVGHLISIRSSADDAHIEEARVSVRSWSRSRDLLLVEEEAFLELSEIVCERGRRVVRGTLWFRIDDTTKQSLETSTATIAGGRSRDDTSGDLPLASLEPANVKWNNDTEFHLNTHTHPKKQAVQLGIISGRPASLCIPDEHANRPRLPKFLQARRVDGASISLEIPLERIAGRVYPFFPRIFSFQGTDSGHADIGATAAKTVGDSSSFSPSPPLSWSIDYRTEATREQGWDICLKGESTPEKEVARSRNQAAWVEKYLQDQDELTMDGPFLQSAGLRLSSQFRSQPQSQGVQPLEQRPRTTSTRRMNNIAVKEKSVVDEGYGDCDGADGANNDRNPSVGGSTKSSLKPKRKSIRLAKVVKSNDSKKGSNSRKRSLGATLGNDSSAQQPLGPLRNPSRYLLQQVQDQPLKNSSGAKERVSIKKRRGQRQNHRNLEEEGEVQIDYVVDSDVEEDQPTDSIPRRR